MLKSINNLFNHKFLRRALVKSRVPLALLACAALATQMKQAWFWPGLAVSVLGAFLQWWCFACLKKQKVLALNGLYSLMRNPMYLARFLLMAGAFLMTANGWLLGGFAALYYFYMVNRVGREEKTLAGIFGAEYETYCREVPRFFPRFSPHPKGNFLYWNWSTFRENNGWRNAIGVLALYAVCWWYVFRAQGS